MQIRQMERPERMPNKIQMLQKHRDANRRSNPFETKIWTMRSSQQSNPSGKLNYSQPTRT